MLSITLNRDFFLKHKQLAVSVKYLYNNKYLRQKYKYKECLLLTQNKDILSYTTCGTTYALQSHEKVDFKLPYPIALNLINAQYEKCSEQIVLDIPDCTMTNLAAFYGDNRPKYIRDTDLQTSVVAINGKRTNIEYIKPEQLVAKFNQLIHDVTLKPISNWRDYQWFDRNNGGEIIYQDMDKVYKTLFSTDYGISSGMFDKPSELQILQFFEKLQMAAQYFGTIKKEIYNENIGNEETYILPYAVFQSAQHSLIWQGIAQKQK